MEHVNHPEHYKANGKECIEVMVEEYGPICTICFCILNRMKYLWRKGKKDGNSEDQDSRKADWYSQYAVHLYSNLPFFKRLLLSIFFSRTFKDICHEIDRMDQKLTRY